MLSGIVYAIKHAMDWGKWVVVVIPPGEPFNACVKHFTATVPEDAGFSGRTARVGKGKVSVASAGTSVFVPKGKSFSVLFLGWGLPEATPYMGFMGPWRVAAAETLSLGQ